ncbi:hypothetical protein MLD38_007003 [Melastoma candidum]|uniref:Uncharacterized protein n=1 Tax=Melastoma candidum TaxID=119954 RepID=A0ACB9RPQ2_9MYRT|nr:hypothetical protein MLD38_007003 [Melastoma candidum]
MAANTRLYLFNNGSLAVKMTGLNAWNMKKVLVRDFSAGRVFNGEVIAPGPDRCYSYHYLRLFASVVN